MVFGHAKKAIVGIKTTQSNVSNEWNFFVRRNELISISHLEKSHYP